ncbi:MAG: hypothetical protein HY719_06175 [Planctomycetes bacterium]|nr:hypothetical protein [Planctomycetota bacterium]
MDPNRRLPLGAQARLLWGKARRWWLIRFRPRYVEEQMRRRRGQCDRSGACCKLFLVCPYLDETTGTPYCVIHGEKPMNCRFFPIDERDLRDRDLLAGGAPCGYSFAEAGATTGVAPSPLLRAPGR